MRLPVCRSLFANMVAAYKQYNTNITNWEHFAITISFDVLFLMRLLPIQIRRIVFEINNYKTQHITVYMHFSFVNEKLAGIDSQAHRLSLACGYTNFSIVAQIQNYKSCSDKKIRLMILLETDSCRLSSKHDVPCWPHHHRELTSTVYYYRHGYLAYALAIIRTLRFCSAFIFAVGNKELRSGAQNLSIDCVQFLCSHAKQNNQKCPRAREKIIHNLWHSARCQNCFYVYFFLLSKLFVVLHV